jgi:hypothetical protein
VARYACGADVAADGFEALTHLLVPVAVELRVDGAGRGVEHDEGGLVLGDEVAQQVGVGWQHQRGLVLLAVGARHDGVHEDDVVQIGVCRLQARHDGVVAGVLAVDVDDRLGRAV